MNQDHSESKFDVRNDEVHLWHCRFDANVMNLEAFKAILSPDELEKADRFKFEIHRRQSIISRGVLRTLLGKYLKKKPRDLQFEYTEYDKPILKDDNGLQFNLSHSGNRVIFGFVQDAEIGVDIEKLKYDFDVLDIAQNFFSPDEIDKLQGLPDEQWVAGFFRCWTRKESFIKAKGSGLSFPLTSFSVSLDAERAQLLRTDWDSLEKEEWRMFTFVPEKDYQLAVSVANKTSHLKQMHWKESL